MEPGGRIGPYTIERLLGEGGMGSVYLARTEAGDHVAIKLVRPELGGDETYLKRFEREARTASRIESAHVVPVVDEGEEAGMPYIVQAFVSGGSLEDRLKSQQTLPLADCVRICADVAAGLDALHAHDLVHRDIKPGNILFDEDGSARITDFGLAKDWSDGVLTRPGQAVGSVDYMAPEQIRGEDVSERSDVYALGCVMCECLSGRPPFGDRAGIKVMFAHLQDPPPDPTAARDDLPAGFAEVVLTALAKDPDDRPSAAGEYAAAVTAAGGA